eukprot:gene856-148_t
MVNNINITIKLKKDGRNKDGSNTWKISENSHPVPFLPDYKRVCHTPTRQIYNRDGTGFASWIDRTYDEAVHWKKNLFKLPSGNAGKAFIKLQADWLRKYNDDSAFKGIALKVYMLLPMILLQKPSPASKSKEHCEALKRRIDYMQKGEFECLLQECRDIQRRIKPKKSQEGISQTFSKLMLQGKVHAALRFLSNESSGGVLDLSDETLKGLREKHPSPAAIKENSLLSGPIKDQRFLNFNINEQKIQENSANLTKGSA